MKKLILTLGIFFLLATAVHSADLAYQSADVASLVGGQPARAARVKNMFDTIKDYVNAVSGGWITNDRIVDDTIQGTKLADAVAGNGLEKDGSENLQIKSYATGALGITSGALAVQVDDIYIEVSGVSNELTLVDTSIDAAKIATSAVETDKINDLAVTEDKLGADSVTTAKIKDGEVDTDDIAAGCITTEKLASETQGSLNPVGTVLTFAGSAAPSGYFICNGNAISRTTYSDLYAVIGTTYGVGDGSTTFNLPDCRGKFLVGIDSSTYNLNTQGGVASITLTAAQSGLPAHTHTYSNVTWTNTVAGGTGTYPTITGYATNTTSSTGGTPASSPFDNRPPFIALNYIIKY